MGTKSKRLALVLVLLIALSSFLLNYTVPVSLGQSVNTSPTFTISIVASINNYSSTCVFGINPDSSINYTSKYDALAVYPNRGVYAYFEYHNKTRPFQVEKLSKYVVPSNGNTTWELTVNDIDQNGTLTLTWSDNNVKSLTLKNGIIKQVYADMNAANNFSYISHPGNIGYFDIVYLSPNPPSPTPSLSASPSSPSTSVPEFPFLIIIPLLLSVLAVAVVTLVTAGLLVYSKNRNRGLKHE